MAPRKARIDRVGILDAALDIIDTEGAGSLTMRKLGSSLGVDPMAVYRHFPGKAELLTGLVDRFWGELRLPERGEHDWRRYAVLLTREIERTLAEHPGLIPVIATHPIETPAALLMADEAIGRLLDAGAPAQAELGDLVNTLVLVTVASALGEHATPAGLEAQEGDLSAEQIEDQSAALAALPHVGRIIAAGWQPSHARRHDRTIRVLLAGWFDEEGEA